MPIIERIKNIDDLKRLLKEGYILKGPRKGSQENLKAIERFFGKGLQFFSEEWLLQQGYKLVEPSKFSKGVKFAFKLIEGYPDKYFKSNYSLLKENKEIYLYLKYQDKQL